MRVFVIEVPGVLYRIDGQVAEVIHKGLAAPTQEELDLGGGVTVCVQDAAGAHADGVGGPTLKGNGVFYRVEVVHGHGGGAKRGFDVDVVDEADVTVSGSVHG